MSEQITTAQTAYERVLQLISPYRELDGFRAGLGDDGWTDTADGCKGGDCVSLLTDPDVSLLARVALGQALALLNLDNRPGVGLQPNGLPDLVWCEVPAGAFLTGSDKKRDPYAYRSEMPQREAVIAYAYQIAKYPITWRQYQAFADSGAYNDPVWWEGFPAEYQPQPLEPQVFQYANHPRDSVSWYQAMAFCRWLTVQYRASGVISENQLIRLPTEHEWEKAARGTDGRVYPFGDDFEFNSANVSGTGIGQTNAVGIFADAASPYGLLDMSGNVYEWCLDEYKNGTDEAVENGETMRVLRGGSFFLVAEWSRCAYRYPRVPSLRLHDFGFRVVLVIE